MGNHPISCLHREQEPTKKDPFLSFVDTTPTEELTERVECHQAEVVCQHEPGSYQHMRRRRQRPAWRLTNKHLHDHDYDQTATTITTSLDNSNGHNIDNNHEMGRNKNRAENPKHHHPHDGDGCASHAASHAARRSGLLLQWRKCESVVACLCRQTSSLVLEVKHGCGKVLHGLETCLFPPPSPLTQELKARLETVPPARVRGGVLLRGCTTAEEHYARIQQVLEAVRPYSGAKGLAQMGLEYRKVPCEAHASVPADLIPSAIDTTVETSFQGVAPLEKHLSMCSDESDMNRITADFRTTTLSVEPEPDVMSTESTGSMQSAVSPTEMDVSVATDESRLPSEKFGPPHCNSCARRLFHKQSSTLIDEDNRKQFIADGDMYETTARLCQEYAHDLVCQDAGLTWLTIEESVEKSTSSTPHHGDKDMPIRMLVNADHPILRSADSTRAASEGNKTSWNTDNPTLFIATGRGRVQAGIFSRKHLIGSGLEMSTALPMIREATKRKWNVMLVDPNVHGEQDGFVVFQKTLDYYRNHVLQSNKIGDASGSSRAWNGLYVLSHSASGGHLVRHLLHGAQDFYTNQIRSIAFTDSTHNIQWTRTQCDPQPGRRLHDMLESDRCVYFKCSNMKRDGDVGASGSWYLHPAGEEVHTDSYWKHRFGNIRTLWAGTKEHSLTNWYAHTPIWNHFDRCCASNQ